MSTFYLKASAQSSTLNVFDVEIRKDNEFILGGSDRFRYTADADCCSESWFVNALGRPITPEDFQPLIGRTIAAYPGIERIDTDDEIRGNLPDVVPRQDYLNGGRIAFMDADTSVDEPALILYWVNGSNGYYRGDLLVYRDSMNEQQEELITARANYKVVIVIGHPGSGKTTYARQMNPRKYVVLDDALSDSRYMLKLTRALESGMRVIMTDPRLCFRDTFYRAFDALIDECISSKNIRLVLFENDVEQCARNLQGAIQETNDRHVVDLGDEDARIRRGRAYGELLDELRQPAGDNGSGYDCPKTHLKVFRRGDILAAQPTQSF